MNEKTLEKTFYLIAKYHLGKLEGFVKIGDDKEEIIELFKDKYCWKNNTFGITEEYHQLLEVNAKKIMEDRFYLENKGEQ